MGCTISFDCHYLPINSQSSIYSLPCDVAGAGSPCKESQKLFEKIGSFDTKLGPTKAKNL